MGSAERFFFIHDGVAKSSIYFVVAGSRNARRTTCTPVRGLFAYLRATTTPSIEIFPEPIYRWLSTFYETIIHDDAAHRANLFCGNGALNTERTIWCKLTVDPDAAIIYYVAEYT